MLNTDWKCVLESSSEEETIALGMKLGALLPSGAVIGLTGVLGAGKTAFTKGVIHCISGTALEDIDSPTFTLVHEYRGTSNNSLRDLPCSCQAEMNSAPTDNGQTEESSCDDQQGRANSMITRNEQSEENQAEKQKTVYHIDLYRIEEDSPVFETDILMLQEYMERLNSIVLVEWADKFLERLADSWLQVDIVRSAEEEQKRFLHFHIRGATQSYLPVLKEMQRQCLH